MSTAVIKYPFELDKTSKKHPCPQCGKKRFVRCIDKETRDYLPDYVGRCDRENGCGYEYTWKQYLQEQGGEIKQFTSLKSVEPPKPTDYLPSVYLERSLQRYEANNFYLFLCSLFGDTITKALCAKYLIATSNYWKGAVAFPQIDEQGNFRQIKVMLHDAKTGKRVKEGATVEKWNRAGGTYVSETTQTPCSKIIGQYINNSTRELNLQQTFFGAHLLTEYPEKDVCIVESEKTAIIASVYLPQFNWLATGGASGCRWREYEVYKLLKGRSVTFFPDYGLFNKKTGKTCYQEWCERIERIREVLPCQIRVSNILETRLADQERKDQDLADLLLVKDESTGTALTEHGYPVMWDFKPENN